MLLLSLGLLQDTITQHDTVDVVHYQAQTIIYDLEKSLIILKDSAFIFYKDIILHSDSSYYHVDVNQLEAFGDCHLKQGADSIGGDYLEYNIETKKARMIHGKTQIEKGYLEGKEVCWVDENTVNVYDGKYTTCSDSPPHYYFYSPKMKVYLGDMVIARPIILYIQGIPVFAAPFWFVPVGSRRKSGLLPFRAGNSRNYGKFIRGFAYYLVISDYADLTLQVDAFEKKGIMPQVEGLWDFSPFTKGTFFVSYIKDNESKRERYDIEARSNSEYFLFGSSFNCDIKYVSDNKYQQDYAETTIVWLAKEITSQATLSREIASVKNSLFFERRENFDDSTIYEKMPNYTITTPSRMLFSLINYSFSGHFNRNRTTSSQDTNVVSGANMQTTPTMQQNILDLFTISPRLILDLAVYDEDTAGNQLPTRLGYSFGTSAATNFYRVYDLEVFGFHGILHKILPRLTYTYTPDFHFGQFPTVDGIPQFSRAHSLGFGLDQEFEAKIGEKKMKHNIMRISLNGGYNLINDSLAPFTFSVNLPYNPFPNPITTFTSQINGSYNSYTKDYTYSFTNTVSLETYFFSLKLNQNYTRGGMYQIWVNGNIKPTRHWALSYSARYDWQDKKFVDYGISLNRDLHCWEGVFSFNQLGTSWRYDFKVKIKEIPEVTIGKGLLGYLIE